MRSIEKEIKKEGHLLHNGQLHLDMLPAHVGLDRYEGDDREDNPYVNLEGLKIKAESKQASRHPQR